MSRLRRGISRKKSLCSIAVPCLLMLMLMLSLAHPGRADGSDPSDAAFQAMQKALDACMQPGTPGEEARIAFSKKYNVPLSKLERLGASNTDFIWHIRCEIEIQSGGVFIWQWRAQQEGWSYQCGREDVEEYCARYYQNCNRWWWEQGCLKRKMPGCFKN